VLSITFIVSFQPSRTWIILSMGNTINQYSYPLSTGPQFTSHCGPLLTLLLSSTLLCTYSTLTALFLVLSKQSVLVLCFEYLTDNSNVFKGLESNLHSEHHSWVPSKTWEVLSIIVMLTSSF
jgi:hypothetical protein